MDFSFTEDQLALRDLARQILEKEVTDKRQKEIDQDSDRVDRKTWGELAKAQLLGVAIPEADGGSGLGFLELGLVAREIGRVAAQVPYYPTIVLGALPLATFGTAEQKRRDLPGVLTGERFLTGAIDEGAGPIAASRQGDRWRLGGIRDCVPLAHLAARIVVLARTGGGRGAFLVDPKAEGVLLERQTLTTGAQAARLTLEGAPAEPLGDPARGDEIARWIVEHATVTLCLIEAGAAAKAVAMTAQYTTGRHQFGRPIATFQAVAQRAADAYVDTQAITWTAWRAADRLARSADATREIAVAKVFASEAGQRIAAAAQHLHGGMGVDVDYSLYRYTLLAKECELSLGGATEQLARLGALIAEHADFASLETAS